MVRTSICVGLLLLGVLAPAKAQSEGHASEWPERQARFRDAQIVENESSIEITVNSPRPLDDVLTALAAKYGWRIDYEDPRYAAADLVDSTAPSWRLEHPEGRHVHNAAGGAFNVKIPMQIGHRPDPERTIAAVVKAYNGSGNPGRFELRASSHGWFDVVPTAAADGPQKPILDTLVGFSVVPPLFTESLRAFCMKLTLQIRQPVKYRDFSIEQGPMQEVQPRIDERAPVRPAREVLRLMLKDSLTMSWRVHYNPDIGAFMLLLRNDAW